MLLSNKANVECGYFISHKDVTRSKEKGLILFDRNIEEVTPLIVACRDSNATIDIIEILFKYNCDIFATTSKRGYTAIHTAATYGYSKRIEIIYNHLSNMTNAKCDKIKIDSFFNQQNKKKKETAYHIAVRNGNIKVIETLLKLCKVDCQIENVNGKKARDILPNDSDKKQWLLDLERLSQVRHHQIPYNDL